MIHTSDILTHLPPMLTGADLAHALTVLPEYDESIRNESPAARLMALSELYKIYISSPMSQEIYSKLYLALMRSLQKKGTTDAIRQRYENHKGARHLEYRGIIGGSDSFTIIGTSGIGKSSAISRALNLITANGIITTEEPYSNIIPCIVVQCPFDSSVKGMLLEILRKVDEHLASKYYHTALKIKATVDMLIGSVSQVALNHISLLVVDEIQNVANSKNGKSLIGALTQLINNSGISICMVGTPESALFFEQAMQLARRSLGLQYSKLGYDQYFCDFCRTLYGYQYVKHKTEFSPAISEWLYEHSSGIISIVVSLIHDAQEIAVLSGNEELNLQSLNEAYQKRLSLLHGHIQPTIKPAISKPITKESPIPVSFNEIKSDFTIAELVAKAKEGQLDVVALLKEHISVEEITV